MAHMIYENNFAYVGEHAWHGLGTQLEPNQPIEKWATTAGFDFRIESAVVGYQPIGTETFHSMPGRNVLYRTDTKKALSVVSNRYNVVQPIEVLEYFRDLCADQSFTLETAGVLREGAVYFALARTGEEFEIANSVHRQYALLSTGCDGTLATTASNTDVRVVCWNTLTASLAANKADQVKTKHNTKFDAVETKRKLGQYDFATTYKMIKERTNALASYKMSEAAIRHFLALTLTGGNAERAFEDGKDDARAIKGLDDLWRCYRDGPGAVHGTAYGALQGVTFYVDHMRQRNSTTRTYSALFTQGARLKSTAEDALYNMAIAA